MEWPLHLKVYASLQKSFIGSISCALRGISVDFNSEKIVVNCIYDGPIYNGDLEEMTLVEAEVSTDFLDHQVEFKCLRVDSPESINHLMLSGWFFKRKE